jgi:hypothetical protein
MIRQLRKNTARTKTVILQNRNMNHWPELSAKTGRPVIELMEEYIKNKVDKK